MRPPPCKWAVSAAGLDGNPGAGYPSSRREKAAT